MPDRTIAEIAVADGRFKTLAAALQAADLVNALKGAGPFTVFAPTDEAFAKLPKGTVEGLLKDAPKLREILLHHLAQGTLIAADIIKLTSVATLANKHASIKVASGKVTIGGAQVVSPDIAASNGVIHVIDSVMLPK